MDTRNKKSGHWPHEVPKVCGTVSSSILHHHHHY